MQRAT
jgi:hypothetical protein